MQPHQFPCYRLSFQSIYSNNNSTHKNTIGVLSCLQRGSEEIIYIISSDITVNSEETTNFPEGKKHFYAVVVFLDWRVACQKDFHWLTRRQSITHPGFQVNYLVVNIDKSMEQVVVMNELQAKAEC